MTFQTVPFNVAGSSYQSRSRPLSSQQTKNWYQQITEEGKEQFVLMPFPGLTSIGYVGFGCEDRGFWRMAETLYQVKGLNLYLIDAYGNHTDKGTIPGTGRCIMADDGENLFIVSDLKVWQYNSLTNLITEVTDPNITGAISVDFINNQFIYTKPKFTSISNVGDGSTVNPLNIIGAESKPDNLVRDYVFQEVIWRMGVRTAEAWYNIGTGEPPIARLEGQIVDIGLASKYAIAQTDNAMYWLGDDHIIYRMAGGTAQAISTDAISNAIHDMARIDDSYAFTYTFQGQNFFQITFPTGNKSFVVNESLGTKGWFEVSSGTGGGKWQGSSLMRCYNKNIVADATNGKVYELDFDAYTNDGDILQRTRVTSSITGNAFNQKGKRVQMSRLELIMNTGVGLIDGQGDNPRIMIEASYDGGRTWSAGTWASTGRLGEFILKVEYFSLATFYDCMFRISTTDAVNYSVYAGSIDIRLAGR